MEIHVADQKILLLQNKVNPDDAQKKAWDKKTTAFDTFSKMTSFLSKPKDDDFELTYSEYRFEPFWHVSARARYVYDRSTTYQIAVTAKEVHHATIHKIDYEKTNGHIHVPVLEHCTQEEKDDVYIDGISGKNKNDLSKYVPLSAVIVKDAIESIVPKNAIIVPPVVRVSAIMRDALSKMIKGIQADTILEEQVEVTCVDLFYRPVHAFQYHWKSKGKEAIVEVDGVTGDTSSGSRVFREFLGKVLDRNFLFDIGADAAGMIIPGGSIAVKAAKRYIDTKK